MEREKVKHERFMRRALSLAQKAIGLTNPNPLVGAVVVKGTRVLGEGYHRAAGCAHAEVLALEKAGPAARGASLYVTLEPCAHFGRTPPCVHKILASGIKEVILAMYDPNPVNKGRGARFLRRQGIKIIAGVLEEEARRLNQVFIKYITQQMPYVTVKVAQSLDGKIATRSGASRWISSKATRQFTHKLRSYVDAILVGVNTILQDDPLLSCRLNGRLYKKQPKKVVLDSRLRLSPVQNIFSSRSPAPVIIATTRFAPRRKLALLRHQAEVLVIKDKEKRVDLQELLRRLAREGLAHVLIEGGGETIASALQEKLVDRMIVLVAPLIIGGRSAPTAVAGEGVKHIHQAYRLADMQLSRVGADIVITGRPV